MTGNNIKNFSIVKLSWPIFIQRLLSMCLGYVDTAMVSNYSELAVGAIGNASQIIGFLTLAFSIIATATGVVVSQYLGANKTEKMDQIYTLSVFFNLVLSGLISIIVTVFSTALLNFMKLPAVMMGDAEAYMRIVGLFLFTNGVMQVFTQIFNCNGRTEIGMLIFFFINVVNILGNYLFLFGPLENLGFGVKGVAISTSISNGVGLVISVIAFIFIIKGRISLKYFRPFPKAMLFKLIKLGIPTAGENISYNISQICITIFVNLLGPLAITTKIYCNILCNFSIVYSSSVAGASSIITGHAVGRGDYDYAYRRVMKTLFWAMLISMAIAGCNLLLSPFTFRLFTDNQDVIKLGFNIMLIGLFLEFGRTSNLVIIQSMRAAGDVVFPTVLGIFSMWGISVVFSWIFTRFFNFGLPGVWIAMAMDEIFRGIVVFIRWQRGTWRGKSVVRQ